MAYIQITTRCNMMCDHCCSRCTPDGEDMDIETYINALALDDETVSLGGGEPTLHPQFWEFMGLALGNVEYVWLATNGTQTQIALALARMAKKEVIGCELSLDMYHDRDMVDDVVVEAFEKLEHGIRDITHNYTKDPIRAGRYLDLMGEDDGEEGCVCSEVVIKPNGDIMACGCEDAPLMGNVNNGGVTYPDGYEWGECWKNQECFAAILT